MIDLRLGDALTILATLPDASVDAVVTDPPAGIGFMSKQFDTFKGRYHFVAFLTEILAECLRVARSGAHALVWALPRTSHWTGTAIEDAGWTIEDRLSHLFATGFPKHKSKLKPACEDWWLATKPGGAKWLGVDACRIQGPAWTFKQGPKTGRTGGGIMGHPAPRNGTDESHPAGRWPANVVLDEEAARMLDEQAGERKSGGSNGKRSNGVLKHGGVNGRPSHDTQVIETAGGMAPSEGGASRFFFVAKPSRRERNAGLEGMPAVVCQSGCGGDFPIDDQGRERDRFKTVQANHHPTVKSVALMRWLCRLACPPGGLILDPFMGSGTTGLACEAEGFGFIGIEQSEEYHTIAKARLGAARAEHPLFAECETA